MQEAWVLSFVRDLRPHMWPKKKKSSKMEMSKDVQDTWGKKDWKNRLRNDDAGLSKSD